MFENRTYPALPSLNALRAFEAMARTGKAVLAAEELGVTHSAVSRQVKALEEALGVRLFTGPKHRLELTDAGRALAPRLARGFDEIVSAVRDLRTEGEDLVVGVNASLSVKWLIPRLGRFAARHPSVKLQLAELPSHATSMRGGDAIVRIMPTSRLSEPAVTAFAPNHIGPVLTPALLERHGGDVLAAPRLTASTHAQGWAIWAALAGVELPPGAERPFAHLHFAMDAAVAGLGAAVLPWPLVAEEVQAGRLCAPLGFRRAESALAVAAQSAPGRALSQFRAWLVEEGAATPPAPRV